MSSRDATALDRDQTLVRVRAIRARALPSGGVLAVASSPGRRQRARPPWHHLPAQPYVVTLALIPAGLAPVAIAVGALEARRRADSHPVRRVIGRQPLSAESR
jgi:hypothetical protein